MLDSKNADYIDAYIRERTVELNQKGIHTFWSCSGIFEDHVTPNEVLPQSAYLCINLKTITPYLTQLAKKINDAAYSPEEWFTNLGHAPSGMEKLMATRRVNPTLSDRYLQNNMWDLEVDCLMNFDDEYDRPCLMIRPHDIFTISKLPEWLQDEHMKLRWDRLFNVLLNLE